MVSGVTETLGIDSGQFLTNGINNIYIGNPGGYPNPGALIEIPPENPWALDQAISEEDDAIRIGIPENNSSEVIGAVQDFLSTICNLESEINLSEPINSLIDDINDIISPLSIPFLSDVIIDIGFFEYRKDKFL